MGTDEAKAAGLECEDLGHVETPVRVGAADADRRVYGTVHSSG
jgi:hypothetical protein